MTVHNDNKEGYTGGKTGGKGGRRENVVQFNRRRDSNQGLKHDLHID